MVGAEGVTGVQGGFQGFFEDIFTDKASNKTDKTSGGTGLCRVLVVAIKYDDDNRTLGRTEDSLNSPVVPKWPVEGVVGVIGSLHGSKPVPGIFSQGGQVYK